MKKASKQAQSIPHDVLKDLLKKNSYSSIKEHILRPADQAWKHSTTSGQSIISFKVKFAGEKSQQQQLRWLTRDHQLFGSDQPLEGNMSVVLSANNSRVESNGKSIHGENFIYITDKKKGFLFLDKTSKTYVQLPEDRKVKHEFKEKISGSVTVGRNDKTKTTTAEILLTAPHKLKYVLELDTEKKWLPFSHDITCMLIGCANLLGKAGLDLDPIIKTGIPVKGEMYMEQAGGRWQKMSSFALTNMEVADGKNKPFDIPAGYRDLREVNGGRKKGDSKTAFGPTVRISDYRNKVNGTFSPGDWNPTSPAGDEPKGGGNPNPNPNQPDNNENTKVGRTGGLKFPACLPETYGALLANLVDEKLLDDIKYIANGISKRLTGFSGSSGNINIDWMTQFKAHADALGLSDPGGGLYDLLHDETPTDASNPQKLGMLDKLAVSSLSKLLADGDTLTSLSLNAALQTAVNNVIADTSVAAEDRFSGLTIENQGLLIDAYIFKGVGTIALTYPATTGTQTIFYGLLNVRLDDIKFDIKINNTEVVSTFDFDSDSIHLVINLPDASGEAWHSRWPTWKYWGLVGITAIACFFFPFTCFLMDMAILVGIFIGLDLAFVSLDLANLVVDSHIRLVPNASNVLQPDVDLMLDADVSAFYMSVIPTGIHQILSLIYDIILNATDVVINTIESQLKNQLNNYLKNDLKITYPPDFGPVPLVGVSNAVEFVADDHGYVEQALNAGLMSIINPYITQIDSDVKPNILTLRDQYKTEFTDPVDEFTAVGGALGWVSDDLSKVARYYLGTVLSQNFINDYIYTLWRQLLFNYDFTPDETSDLFSFLKVAFPDLAGLEDKQITAHLWPAVPPRTLFTPKPASEGSFYATTFFDDVRICFEFNQDSKKIPNIMEFAFAGQVVTEIGFGGYNSTIGKLDLLKLTDRVFDIYFDLKTVGVTIIHPEVEYFAFPGIAPAVNFDYSPLDLLQEMFKRGLAYSLSNRDSSFIPRNSGDPMYIQRYPLGNDVLQVIFQLVPFRGNLYISKGLSGKATAVYQGALDIDTMTKLMADLIRALV